MCTPKPLLGARTPKRAELSLIRKPLPGVPRGAFFTPQCAMCVHVCLYTCAHAWVYVCVHVFRGETCCTLRRDMVHYRLRHVALSPGAGRGSSERAGAQNRSTLAPQANFRRGKKPLASLIPPGWFLVRGTRPRKLWVPRTNR